MSLGKKIFEKIKKGDQRAREQFFNANTGLIWACVKRYSGLLDQEDLYQLGAIGLLKAVDRFDPSYGVSFSTYAVPLILGEIRRYLRDSSSIRVSRRLKEIALMAKKVSEKIKTLTGREPSVKEIAEEIGVEVDTLCEALDATSPVLYLEDLAVQQDRTGLHAPMGDEERSLEIFDLKEALSRLDENMRLIIEGRFYLGKTQHELSSELGISQAHVSRLEKKALFLLKRFLQGRKGEFECTSKGNTTGREE